MMRLSITLCFAVLVGLIAFASTRNIDGIPELAIVGFGGISVMYWMLIGRLGERPLSFFLADLFLFECAVIVALIIKPELDGMAGVLNTLIPGAIALMVVVGYGIAMLKKVCGNP